MIVTRDHLLNGLLSFYPLDEGGPSRAEDLRGNRPGTPVGTSVGAGLARRRARNFDGSTGYVTAPRPTLGTRYSIFQRVKPSAVDATARIVSSCRIIAAGSGIQWQITCTSSATTATVRDDAGNIATSPGPALVANRSALVGLIRNGNSVQIVVDNVMATAGTGALGTLTVDSFNIGALVANTSTRSSFWSGLVSDVGIWNRPLTQPEVWALLESPDLLVVERLRRRRHLGRHRMIFA